MNRIKDLIIQFCKFGAVGGLCFGIDYGLMIFLTETHIMHYFASSAVSFTVSVIVNYILSMRFVFTGKEDMTKAQEMVIFVALSMIGLLEYEFREKFRHIEENFYIMSPFSRLSGHIPKKYLLCPMLLPQQDIFVTLLSICPTFLIHWDIFRPLSFICPVWFFQPVFM